MNIISLSDLRILSRCQSMVLWSALVPKHLHVKTHIISLSFPSLVIGLSKKSEHCIDVFETVLVDKLFEP